MTSPITQIFRLEISVIFISSFLLNSPLLISHQACCSPLRDASQIWVLLSAPTPTVLIGVSWAISVSCQLPLVAPITSNPSPSSMLLPEWSFQKETLMISLPYLKTSGGFWLLKDKNLTIKPKDSWDQPPIPFQTYIWLLYYQPPF